MYINSGCSVILFLASLFNSAPISGTISRPFWIGRNSGESQETKNVSRNDYDLFIYLSELSAHDSDLSMNHISVRWCLDEWNEVFVWCMGPCDGYGRTWGALQTSHRQTRRGVPGWWRNTDATGSYGLLETVWIIATKLVWSKYRRRNFCTACQ